MLHELKCLHSLEWNLVDNSDFILLDERRMFFFSCSGKGDPTDFHKAMDNDRTRDEDLPLLSTLEFTAGVDKIAASCPTLSTVRLARVSKRRVYEFAIRRDESAKFTDATLRVLQVFYKFPTTWDMPTSPYGCF